LQSGGKIYWIGGPWKGRLAIVPRPRGGDWLEDEVRNWKGAGLDVVVSLLTTPEEHELSLLEEAQLCQKYGLRHLSFPIIDLSIPSSLAATLNFVAGLDKALDEGKVVGIHCRQGIGRSGMISACLLMMRGSQSAEASQLVSGARGCPVPETQEQREWMISFEKKIEAPLHRR
jgi:protein-tyrosine phosphatase